MAKKLSFEEFVRQAEQMDGDFRRLPEAAKRQAYRDYQANPIASSLAIHQAAVRATSGGWRNHPLARLVERNVREEPRIPGLGSRPEAPQATDSVSTAQEQLEEAARASESGDESRAQQLVAAAAAALGVNLGGQNNILVARGIEKPWIQRLIKRKYEELTGRSFRTVEEFASSAAVINDSENLELAIQQALRTGAFAETVIRPTRANIERGEVTPGLRVPTSAYAQAAAVGSADLYLKYLIDQADRAGVPWQLVWGIIRAESGWNLTAVGDSGSSHGLAQIHLPSHPEVSVSEARNPRFAIDWTITNLRRHFALFNDWGLAALAHNSPGAARFLYQHGYSGSGRGVKDRQYLSRVFAGLEELGYGQGPEGEQTLATADYIEAVGGEAAGDAIPIPDRDLLRQNAEQLIRSWFFRDPTPGEVDQLVQGQVDAIANAYRRNLEINNPFKDQDTQTRIRAGTLVQPVPGGQVTDSFGAPRDGGRRSHEGIDIFAPEGTPVVAAASGTVVGSTSDRLGGVVVRIQGDDGRYYYYAHLREGSVRVRQGDHVSAGQQIAEVGATGNARGTPFHLHFGIYERRGGRAIDPHDLVIGGTAMPADMPADPRAGSAQFDEDVDPNAQLIEQIRQTQEYQRLFGMKPAYQTEDEYASQFRGAGEELVGEGRAPGEAIRFGMERNDPLTTAGYIAGQEGATSRNRTFRERLFETVALIQNTI